LWSPSSPRFHGPWIRISTILITIRIKNFLSEFDNRLQISASVFELVVYVTIFGVYFALLYNKRGDEVQNEKNRTIDNISQKKMKNR